MILIVPTICFLLAAAIGAWCIKAELVIVFWGLAAGCFAGLAINNAIDQNTPSFEAIDNAIYAALFFAPALAGILVGGLFGWWRWRRS